MLEIWYWHERATNADLWICRIESHGSDHEFLGFSFHGLGGVVG